MALRSALIQKKEEVVAENGTVVAESVEAAEAGLEIFEKGGNAVDAAVATSFASTTCEPAMSSLGGGGAALIYLADEDRIVAIEFEGRLPRAATEDMFISDLLPRGRAASQFWLARHQKQRRVDGVSFPGGPRPGGRVVPNPGKVRYYEPGRSHRSSDKDLRRGL